MLIIENSIAYWLATLFSLLILDKRFFGTVWELWQKIVAFWYSINVSLVQFESSDRKLLLLHLLLINVLLVSQEVHSRKKRLYQIIRQYQKVPIKQREPFANNRSSNFQKSLLYNLLHRSVAYKHTGVLENVILEPIKKWTPSSI